MFRDFRKPPISSLLYFGPSNEPDMLSPRLTARRSPPQQLMVQKQRRAQRSSGIARRRRNPDVLKNPGTQQYAVGPRN